MNTVPTSATIHAAITARRWVTHQRATRRISFLLGRSPRVGDVRNETTEHPTLCRRRGGRTSTTPRGAGTAAGQPSHYPASTSGAYFSRRTPTAHREPV